MKKTTRIISVLLAITLMVGLFSTIPVSAASLKITTQPKTSYTAYGDTAKATIKASGDGLKYTWYYKNSGATKYTKSSVTKSTYSIKMTDKIKNRKVYCVVKDKKGNSVKSSTIALRMKATIVTEPSSVKVANKKTAKVTVKAKGDGLKYAWYYKNKGATKYTKSSVTTSSYSVKMSDKIDGRNVYCIVTDKYGKKDKSKTVTLKSTGDPLVITNQPQNTSASSSKDQVGFGIVVTGGKAPYTYKLKYTYAGLDKWVVHKNAEVLKLGSMTEFVITPSFAKQYLYYIEVTDAAGNKVNSNVVWVEKNK